MKVGQHLIFRAIFRLLAEKFSNTKSSFYPGRLKKLKDRFCLFGKILKYSLHQIKSITMIKLSQPQRQRNATQAQHCGHKNDLAHHHPPLQKLNCNF